MEEVRKLNSIKSSTKLKPLTLH